MNVVNSIGLVIMMTGFLFLIWKPDLKKKDRVIAYFGSGQQYIVDITFRDDGKYAEVVLNYRDDEKSPLYKSLGMQILELEK